MKIHESFTRRAYNCLNVLDHFVRLALKGLKSVTKSKNKNKSEKYFLLKSFFICLATLRKHVIHANISV